MVLTKKVIVKTMQDNTRQLRAYGVKNIGIFGSFAKLSATEKSDIDVLVDFRKGQKSFDNYMELKFLLERLLRRKVDLVIKGALKPRIKQSILKETEYARL